MIEWPLAVFILGLILMQEVWGSGRRFSEVSRKFWLLSIKSKSPSPELSALLFATLATLCFAFWESILRFLLQASAGWGLSLVGATLLFAVLGVRAQRYRKLAQRAWPMRAQEWSAVVIGTMLMIHGWATALVLGAWVVWRSLKALPRAS
ncbi:MAG TPA: hypothetical protein VM901_02850 [Bdellovibrionota bacterium]|jgi:hypothetical protein|nr:hypothetical protein [Bdellovibrionota bacterium]